MPFSWTDTFSGKSVSVSDIAYEQASILFNLGTLRAAHTHTSTLIFDL
jgi:hypothetical protein